jgi:hypothetical protein
MQTGNEKETAQSADAADFRRGFFQIRVHLCKLRTASSFSFNSASSGRTAPAPMLAEVVSKPVVQFFSASEDLGVS